MRNDSISIAKGIGIILMVLAHTRFSLYGINFINMFHMPLFFFFSGYCFKSKYLVDFNSFAIKRIKGVYWPYVKWGLLFLLLHNSFFYLNIINDEFGFRENVSYLYNYKDYFIHAFNIIFKLNDCEELLGGFWFLHTLFFSSFIFYVVVKLIRYHKLGGALLLFLTMMLLIIGIQLPFLLVGPREILGAFFMIAGFVYKENGYNVEKKWFIIPISAFIVILGTNYWQCCMLNLTWQKVIPYSMSAIAGILMVFAVSNCILRHIRIKNFLVYTGDHTLEILVWHFLSFKLVNLLIIGIYTLQYKRLAEFPVIDQYSMFGWWFIYLVVGVGVPLWGCEIIERIKSDVWR